jgi:hypothetical protein
MHIFKFLVLAFYSFSLLAQSPSLKECNKHKEEVLNKAFFEDEEALKKDKNNHNIRFVKNEKNAIDLLMKYDVTKLGGKFNLSQSILEVESCTNPNDKPSAVKYCEDSFSNYNYFRGLIYGLKHYDWSEKTRSLAMEKFWIYVNESTKTKQTLLETIMAINLVKQMSDAGLITKPGVKQVNDLERQAENADNKLRKDLKNQNGKQMNCTEFKNARTKEIDLSQDLAAKLKALLT